MSQQESDSKDRTVDGTADAAEVSLIAELTDWHRDSLGKQDALSTLRQSVSPDGYRELVRAAEIGQAKVKAVKVMKRYFATMICTGSI
jgi:hypothetical protein